MKEHDIAVEAFAAFSLRFPSIARFVCVGPDLLRWAHRGLGSPLRRSSIVAFVHQLNESTTLTSSYSAKCSFFELRRRIRVPRDGTLDEEREDLASLVVNACKFSNLELQWGTHDVLRLRCNLSEQASSSQLFVSALFPAGFESWCQLLGNASLGVRKTFSISEHDLCTAGVQTSSDEMSGLLTAYGNLTDSVTAFLLCEIRSAATSSQFVVEKRWTRLKTRLSLSGINNVGCSVSFALWKKGSLSMYLDRWGEKWTRGVVVEWF